MEEERRLAYVVDYSSKRKIYLCLMQTDECNFGSIKMNKRSRFLDEVPNKTNAF